MCSVRYVDFQPAEKKLKTSSSGAASVQVWMAWAPKHATTEQLSTVKQCYMPHNAAMHVKRYLNPFINIIFSYMQFVSITFSLFGL